MRWGLIARADHGGLGNLSREIAAHLKPDATLVLDMGTLARGPQDPTDFEHVTIARVSPRLNFDGAAEAQVRRWLQPLDMVLCLETFYDHRFARWARIAGTRTHLYAMRELLGTGAEYDADKTWLPCEVGPDSGLPTYTAGPRELAILPWPMSPDRVRRAHRTTAGNPIYVHQAARAMLDRNGTDVVLAAADLLEQPCTIVIYGTDEHGIEQRGNADLVWIGAPADTWPDLYTAGDALLLPRRYGWLSLPILEAAAAAMPTVTTNLWPQSHWPAITFDAGPSAPARMKGGTINVYEPKPEALAAVLDRQTLEHLHAAGDTAYRWALENSWQALEPRWREALES